MTEKATEKPHVPAIDSQWLEMTHEDIIAVDYPVIDAHFHLWDFSEPPYFGDIYRTDALSAGIQSSVFVECSMGYRTTGPQSERPIGEVEFACNQGETHSTQDCDIAAAVVGMVDVTLGNRVAPILEKQIEAGGGRFRGIRIRAAYDSDPSIGYGPKGATSGVLGHATTRAALMVLGDLGLSLDVYIFHNQLHDVVDLARAMPDLPIVLNHFGAPLGIGHYAQEKDQVYADWKNEICALKHFDNVKIKIGGFAISRLALVERGGRQKPPSSLELAENFRPWVEHCLNTVGADRCMFGSNFAVDKAAMSMTTCVNAMKRLARDLSPDDASALMSGTAQRFYQL